MNVRRALGRAAAFGDSAVMAAIVCRWLTGTTVKPHGYPRTTGWRVYDAACVLADRRPPRG